MVETAEQTPAQFYDHLVQDVNAGLLLLDEKGTITAVNQIAADLLEQASNYLVGQPVTSFWPDSLPLPELMPVGVGCEAHIILKSGRVQPIILSISPLTGTTARSRLVSMMQTATVQRFNESLSHAQRLAGVGIMTASVAHELNTPISIITATISNLRLEMNSNELSAEQLSHYVEMIEHSAWRCARVVEVLRNYTLDSEPQKAITDLNMIIEDGLTLIKHQLRGEFNIQIRQDLDLDLKTIQCDHNRLTQVLINLLTNARDAMPEGGGTLTIKSWAVTENEALNGDQSPCQFGFSVQDTGHGIPPEIMDKIFEPFFTTKPMGRGTGLGLFIARRIVQQHNGRIWAANNPDGGAIFTVLLP